VAGSNLGPISFITFNYDLCFDYMLYFHRERLDYCFDDKSAGGVPVMKLHGSVNWWRGAGCKTVMPWTLQDFFQKISWGNALMFGKIESVVLDVGAKIEAKVHCEGHSCEAVIVPPTWNKAEYQQIANVWRHAALPKYSERWWDR